MGHLDHRDIAPADDIPRDSINERRIGCITPEVLADDRCNTAGPEIPNVLAKNARREFRSSADRNAERVQE